MKDSTSPPSEILVVGAGMAAHRFVERLLRDPGAEVRVTVIGDEGDGPYDRSALVGLLTGIDGAQLQLDRSVFRDDRVRLIRDDRVLHVDPSARTARTRSRRTYSYDTLVLATGSFAARVAVSGARLPGCFVLRTIEDAESVREFVDSRSRALGRPLRGVVIGGGLHGIETAVALHDAGVATTIVQYADRLLPALLDGSGADILRAALEERGIAVRTRTRATRLDPDDSGAVTALEFQDGSFQRADVVVFTVGVRPRDELARNAGLDVHPRGGIVIDERCATSDPHILAIGEAACFDGRCVDAAAPAQATADVAAARLLGGAELFPGHGGDAHHTIAGIDLASFGEHSPGGADAVEVVTHRSRGAGVYRKLVLTDDAQTLLGGVLVGDTTGHAALRRLVGGLSPGELAAELRRAAPDRDDSGAVCVHMGMSPQELSAALRADELFTFSAVGVRFGRESGCERCTSAVARALTELATERSPSSVRTRRGGMDGSDARQDRARSDGPRVLVSSATGVDLTPVQLIDIGHLAQDLGLTLRIVGSRIELLGVSRDQRTALRDRLTAAGLAGAAPLAHGGQRFCEEPPRRTDEQVSADPSSYEEPHHGRGEPLAIGWAGRGRNAGPLRSSPIRAESPA
ncbi:NAD(P)/FAD-dependent oxidoreductase [Microbacterium sp. NPDC091662]|uniref:NAD(P)/FAD-dependent oxidoreductase n=1 Tax=Microbacterium sp. NPDC091662 TaxID=3364211 RepID=UPI003808FC68